MDWTGTVANELESGQIIGAHAARSDCTNDNCPLHHPSYHPLVFHPRWWVAETAVMWRVCSCEVLHPDVDMMPELVCTCTCRCCEDSAGML